MAAMTPTANKLFFINAFNQDTPFYRIEIMEKVWIVLITGEEKLPEEGGNAVILQLIIYST